MRPVADAISSWALFALPTSGLIAIPNGKASGHSVLFWGFKPEVRPTPLSWKKLPPLPPQHGQL